MHPERRERHRIFVGSDGSQATLSHRISSSVKMATSTMDKSKPLVGVLALQGAFEEHQACLEAAGCRTVQVSMTLNDSLDLRVHLLNFPQDSFSCCSDNVYSRLYFSRYEL